MIIIPTEKRFDWKHTPVVLFTIVFINVFIYFTYQSKDEEKLELALSQYQELGYFKTEWPIYKQYLLSKDQNDLVSEFEELIKEQEEFEQFESSDEYQEVLDNTAFGSEIRAQMEALKTGAFFESVVASALLTDREFYPHLQSKIEREMDSKAYQRWLNYRPEVQNKIESISYFALGANAQDFSVITLITSQFLHGDVMHLFGNMFFLLICGFAVEAVIGRINFLLFYILSGIAAAALHIYFNQDSYSPLIGASGSISGVMAMYLGVFKLKKIEFFYWFFVFVGYLRAPAMAILPVYIGKELYFYLNEPDSNVAFLAHTGGFIAGALVILTTHLLRPQWFNQEYIEQEQDSVSAEQEQMDKIYHDIEALRFDTALKSLTQLIKQEGMTLDRLILRYNLLKLKKNKAYAECVVQLLTNTQLHSDRLDSLERIWLENKVVARKLSDDQKLKIGWSLTGLDNLSSSEQIFSELQQSTTAAHGLVNFANKLAKRFQSIQRPEKANYYLKIAKELA